MIIKTLGIAAAALLALLAGGCGLGGAPAEAFSAPTGAGRVFAGQAHDYEGAGAELYLVQGNQTIQAVGRIEAGGRFRFELPPRLALSRLTSMMAQHLKTARGSTAGMSPYNQARFAEWPGKPESAVHALFAGEGWSDLVVEPLEMNIARYGVAYGSSSEFGDLFAANGEMGRIATPGQAMVVLVYADRAGRMRGNAHALNAFGAEVSNRWDLQLQAGWNLVTSEQAAEGATLVYRSGPLPEDLEWWTFKGR